MTRILAALLLVFAFAASPFDRAELKGYDTTGLPSVLVIERKVPQSVAVFGMPGIKRDDPDWYAAMVVNQIFGSGGFSSRLMEEVRRKRGLTYGVYTYLQPYTHAGLVLGSVATVNARMGESKQVIEAEIARNAWLNVAASEHVLFETLPRERYSQAMRLLGFDAVMLSEQTGRA